ncbi:MAG TPA: YwqG family protein [Kofleriaceae bacterium]|nr:YwqG family protein [Kofleriaceae bacterium]
MDAAQVLKVLSDHGHGDDADAIAPLLQPAFRITATALAPRPGRFRNAVDDEPIDADKLATWEAALAALPLGASRFGGVPDLPPGVAWPERAGVPMEFIAQVRLADVSDPRLPAAGSLAFFYNSQWGTTDNVPDEPCCAVVFHDGPDDALVRATPPQVEWKSEFVEVTQFAPFLHGLASLRFEPTVTLPGGVSPFIAAPLDAWWQDFDAYHRAAFTGTTEGQPSSYVLGYVDEQDYVDAHANGTDDQLLLQVDSDGAAEFQFGDCNKLFFLLTKDELAARDFSGVRVYSLLG